MSGLTAWQYLIGLVWQTQSPAEARPDPLEGKSVMINGAGGRCRSPRTAVSKTQGRARDGCRVRPNETFLRDLGADKFIDYTKFGRKTRCARVDLVVDAVGGPTASRFLRSIRRGGALVNLSAWLAGTMKPLTFSVTGPLQHGY